MKRENYYARAEEQFVKAVILYANESDILYYDECFAKPVAADEVVDLFLDRCCIASKDSKGVRSYTAIDGATGKGELKVGADKTYKCIDTPADEE